MKIGIDISQIVYQSSGVGTYVRKLVTQILSTDGNNEYILFGASLRRQEVFHAFLQSLPPSVTNVRLVTVAIPPTILDILWNVFHIIPIEWLIGPVDVFWSSDWTQPPLQHARGVTTIHDVSIFRFPESFHKKILAVQKRRLRRAVSECTMLLCDSQATLDDVKRYFAVDERKLRVIYPGFL
jgi:hypothetical protein